MTTLPEGWAQFCIADVGGTVGGKTPNKAEPRYWEPAEVPWASPKDMKSFRLIDTQDRLATLATVEAGMAVLPVGTVLMVTRSGILAHTFPVAITEMPTTINQDIKAVVPGPLVEPRYLAYCLRSRQAEILGSCSKAGTTVASVETELLEKLHLPLAPVAEQQRIADKLDDLLARVDACRNRLDRVPAVLKRFRQAVLAAATSGELTRDWRRERGLDDVPQRAPKGELPLPNVPGSWKWYSFSELIASLRSGTSLVPIDAQTDIPVLRSSAVRQGAVDLHDIRYLPGTSDLKPGDILEDGDLLFTRLSGSLEYVANCAHVDGLRGQRIAYPDRLFRVQLCEPAQAPYIELCFGVSALRSRLEAAAKSSAGHQRISMSDLRQFLIPLPPEDERREIIRRVKALVGRLEMVFGRYTSASQSIGQVTTAILAKAFRGDLVPHDPDDEPASVVLERIRAERNSASAPSGRGRRSMVTVGAKP